MTGMSQVDSNRIDITDAHDSNVRRDVVARVVDVQDVSISCSTQSNYRNAMLS